LVKLVSNGRIARQPEASGKIQTAMLIAAALIEGIGFSVIRFLIKTKNNSCNGWL
jgi:F0F1-type ATP synthase membrane subunit c/vacuolar-type H+-ATPase subunit K